MNLPFNADACKRMLKNVAGVGYTKYAKTMWIGTIFLLSHILNTKQLRGAYREGVSKTIKHKGGTEVSFGLQKWGYAGKRPVDTT